MLIINGDAYPTNQNGNKMNKEESLRVLILLSQMEGFTIGKFGDHCLPDWISEELVNVCELLEKNIRGE